MIKIIHAARESLALRRADRAQWAALVREIAGYTSHRHRLELEAVLGRYSDEETRDIRAILSAQPA